MNNPTTLEQLEEWMRAPKEREGLEFKAARTHFSGDKLMDYCVGIANDFGGKLILGVTDRPPREVVGTPAIGDTQDMQKKILDKLHFEVKIETEAVSLVINDTVQAGKIKSDDPSRTSRKFAKYVPYWA